MIIHCDYCRKNKENWKPYRTNYCPACVKDKKIGGTTAIERVFLKDYGYESVKRLQEMDRRVILPTERKDGNGGYYLGRRGENGKIQEKHPTY